MSARQSKSPDTAALLAALGEAMELCRRLDLPKEAAVFEGFIARFQKEPLTYEVLRDEVRSAINGITGLRILSKLGDDYSEFNRIQTAFGKVAFPEAHERYERIKKRKHRARKAVRKSQTFWQLDGESDLHAITIPDPPQARAATTVRLAHSNSYGPFDGAEFFVRVGDPAKPTKQDDLDSASDWVRALLVEEFVTVDDEEMLRSEAREPLDGETPWEGTYDAQLVIPAGQHSIEVKIISRQPELLRSLVLTGWDITVGG
jgi:hypothetical protein